jgi:hypothetical protein
MDVFGFHFGWPGSHIGLRLFRSQLSTEERTAKESALTNQVESYRRNKKWGIRI